VQSTDTIVIGAGQAGLSLSHHLARARRRHVVLERGRIGERWRSERWDSLALLTPNWLNRLDGGDHHAEPDGYLSKHDFVAYLRRYAGAHRAPVHEQVTVEAVERASGGGFHVRTDTGRWRAGHVVIATGDSAEPFVPDAATRAPATLRQLHSSDYRNPAQLPPGGVLVVGAGPSGQQIAAELRRVGRDVVLAVGRHARVPRRYRGRDIWHWVDRLGALEQRIDDVRDPSAAKRTPSFTLTGVNGGEQLDLAVLDELGVAIAGRFGGFEQGRALFADDLRSSVGEAEGRLQRLLTRIDAHIEALPATWPYAPDRPAPVRVAAPLEALDLARRRISTVIWATGYRRSYPWLHVPSLDERGEIAHRHGITHVPGLYVLGLKFQRRRGSHLIGRVGRDAAFLARRIASAESAVHGG
jgi:putative flavoprotein involved in K+ transport